MVTLVDVFEHSRFSSEAGGAVVDGAGEGFLGFDETDVGDVAVLMIWGIWVIWIVAVVVLIVLSS